MVTKKLQYHDLDGELREDVFYFSMNKAEFTRLNREFPGGLEEAVARAQKNKDADEMFHIIDRIVCAAYGERMLNGFIKKAPNGQPLSDFFCNTEAYDVLLEELLQDEDKLMGFMTACLNKDSQDKTNAKLEELRAQRVAAEKADGEKPALSLVN